MNDIIEFVDQDGNTVNFRVLFTTKNELTNELYAFFAELEAVRPQVLVYKVADDGQLIDLNEEELAYAQQEFNNYIARNYGGGCGGCHGGCGSDCYGDCECDGDCH